ncbi:portal protein [Humitalea sp. 24SJ18S-53]|uniref:portal protein n=1 Tax=Humitalea sp. 24SJ18S-53 TaxID=3422307 RepID=UPI003D66D3E5
MTPETLLLRHQAALDRRRPWEATWQDCRDHVLARTPGQGGPALFDGTAADAAEQLAASLLAELTPPWSRWFGLQPTRGMADTPGLSELLEDASETLAGHLDRGGLSLAMHQAFLDLVVCGTGVLLVEEAPPGELSALRLTAVPLSETVLEDSGSGRLDTIYRSAGLTPDAIRQRFPKAVLPKALTESKGEPPRLPVLEAVWPDGRGAFRFAAVLAIPGQAPLLLADGEFAESPFIAFRWLVAPGETYGRGPVMKALPDIRTANKVVELILKNASIAATGIWQADDDGVLNPATVRLVPGAIIPKAPGSAGLTPLAAPGNFDVSNLVLDDLRSRIRTALLADRLSPKPGQDRTATEVLERSAETARTLGACYGRLQHELLSPLVVRSLGVLRRRGEVPPILLDGQEVRLAYRSPLARLQARADAANTALFLQSAAALGPAGLAQIDAAAAARFLARTLDVPDSILTPLSESPSA